MCDLVIYTKNGIHIDNVRYDAEFCQKAVTKCTLLFFNEIMPEILTKEIEKSLPVPPVHDKSICFCRKPGLRRVMVCANADCNIKKFHYSCVSVTKKPKSDWLCPVCRRLLNVG